MLKKLYITRNDDCDTISICFWTRKPIFNEEKGSWDWINDNGENKSENVFLGEMENKDFYDEFGFLPIQGRCIEIEINPITNIENNSEQNVRWVLKQDEG